MLVLRQKATLRSWLHAESISHLCSVFPSGIQPPHQPQSPVLTILRHYFDCIDSRVFLKEMCLQMVEVSDRPNSPQNYLRRISCTASYSITQMNDSCSFDCDVLIGLIGHPSLLEVYTQAWIVLSSIITERIIKTFSHATVSPLQTSGRKAVNII